MATSFRAVRWIRTLNLVLQAVLFLTFFGGLNYVAKSHVWRFDLTQQRKFSLSPETLSYIKNLQRPVHIVMTTSAESENPEVKGLIDEYFYATADNPAGRITKETLDVYQNRRRAEELGIEQPDLLVLISGDKRPRIVTVDELYTRKDKQRHTFQGEQVLTDAILNVATAVRQKICFLDGHGELRADDPDTQNGLSRLRDQLKVRNFDLETINLTAARGVPADASLVVAVRPRNKYSRAEEEMLRQYLGANAGRMLLFLEPGVSTAAIGLEDLLLDWGVLVQNDWVIDVDPTCVAENGDLLVWAFAEHPITKTMRENRWQLRLGGARTVMPDPGRALGGGLHTVTLAATSKTAWGERDARTMPPKFDPGVDTRPLAGMDPPDRLGLVVASERVAMRDNLPFSVPTGKLVVFGTGDMMTNSRMDQSNFSLFLNAVNWTVERDRQLNIAPRPVERFALSLSAADFTRLRYALLLGLPGGALLLGLLVYWTRRA